MICEEDGCSVEATTYLCTEHSAASGQLLVSSGRTGVIVATSGPLTRMQAEDIRTTLERRFPGVTFGVVDQCSGVAAFTFDDEAPS